LLAPRHNLLAGESAVGSHNDAHLAPKALPNRANDFRDFSGLACEGSPEVRIFGLTAMGARSAANRLLAAASRTRRSV
jgi:hypothetical protein